MLEKRAAVAKPKVFIIDMFGPEADIWYGIPEFNLLAHNVSVIGLSPSIPGRSLHGGWLCLSSYHWRVRNQRFRQHNRAGKEPKV